MRLGGGFAYIGVKGFLVIACDEVGGCVGIEFLSNFLGSAGDEQVWDKEVLLWDIRKHFENC